jgi:membrane-associated phospholipid phosphatase
VTAWLGTSRAARPSVAFLAGLVLLACAAFWTTGLSIDRALLLSVSLPIAWIAGSSALLRSRGYPALADYFLAVAILASGSFAAAMLSYPFAAASGAYVDGALLAADQRLGFDWPRLMERILAEPAALDVLFPVYNAIGLQPAVVLAALFATRRESAAWTLVMSWMLAVTVSVASVLIAPALGPFDAFAIDARAPLYIAGNASDAHRAVLASLRSGELHHIGRAHLIGLATIPSFHTAAALICVWGAVQIRWLWVLAIPFNALMILATITVGAHYLVDILAGILSAGACLVVARWSTAANASRRPHP